MPRTGHRQPRPLIRTVLGGVISGITRTLLDRLLEHHTWLLEHLGL